MSWTMWVALVVTIGAVVALIKRYETRLVLITAGLLMAFISFEPMIAFKQFDKSMTNGSLIIAICSAMGFAAVVSLTKCDVHLVALLTKPLKKLGILLLPACMFVVSLISIAIPSTSGLVAAVGPTVIPLMVRAGFHPAIAAATVVGSITTAYLSPGVSHNAFIAKLAKLEVMDFITRFSGFTVGASVAAIVLMVIVCLVYRDFRKEGFAALAKNMNVSTELPEKPNILFAFAPMLPVIILVCASLWAPQLKMSVATAMLIGAIYAIAVTRTNPADVTKKFFDGMGSGYAKIMGIIIAAGVFAAGLQACGVISAFVDYLTHANEVAKLGAALGPYLMALVTGSGDAAAFAFNEAVTPHAAQFGLSVDSLGYLAAISGNFGRLSSPLAGGMIIAAGIAGVSPFEIAKRTAPVMLVLLIGVYAFS